jgi:hypothetical protein
MPSRMHSPAPPVKVVSTYHMVTHRCGHVVPHYFPVAVDLGCASRILISSLCAVFFLRTLTWPHQPVQFRHYAR